MIKNIHNIATAQSLTDRILSHFCRHNPPQPHFVLLQLGDTCAYPGIHTLYADHSLLRQDLSYTDGYLYIKLFNFILKVKFEDLINAPEIVKESFQNLVQHPQARCGTILTVVVPGDYKKVGVMRLQHTQAPQCTFYHHKESARCRKGCVAALEQAGICCRTNVINDIDSCQGLTQDEENIFFTKDNDSPPSSNEPLTSTPI